MSSTAIAGSDASRPARSRILTPSSEGSTNHKDELRSPERHQRKRADSATMEHLLKPSIAVKVSYCQLTSFVYPDLSVILQPHPPKLHVQPRILYPLMVLPRERLPLSSIDFHATSVDLASLRLFESHIKILDLESRMGSVPVVLIARKEASRAVYVLEKQESGLYAICRLGPWVDLDLLASHSSAVCRERLHRVVKSEHQNPNGPSAITTPHIHKEEKSKRAAIEAIQSLVRKRPRSQSVSTLAESVKQETGEAATPTDSKLPSPTLQPAEPRRLSEHAVQPLPSTTPTAVDIEVHQQQTKEDIFDTLRTQYFDMLYKSMVSINNFALSTVAKQYRDRSHTLPKGRFRALVQHFSLISNRISTWTILSNFSKVLS